MWTATFWKDAAERAIKTGAQTLIGFFAGSQVVLGEVDWGVVGTAVGVAVGLSVLTSVVSSRVGDPESASLVDGGVGK